MNPSDSFKDLSITLVENRAMLEKDSNTILDRIQSTSSLACTLD